MKPLTVGWMACPFPHDDPLGEALARAAAIMETVHDGVITIDVVGDIESANEAAARIFGRSIADLVEMNVRELMPEPYRSQHDGYLTRYLKTGEARIIGSGREVVGQRADGSTFPMDLAVSEVLFDGQRLFTGIVRDISERRGLEEQVLQLGTDERRRVGQELHDGLQQDLAAAGFALQRLENRLRRPKPPVGFDPAEEVAEVHRMLDAAIDQTRHIARGLYPVKLEADGLHAGLEELTDSLSRIFGVVCTFVGAEDAAVDDHTAQMHLYRIAQEAANNALRHGHADRVCVSLAREDSEIVLLVDDNGSGLPQDGAPASGMGLHTMAFRARMIGCTFEIGPGPEPGGGTRVRVRMPAAPLRAIGDAVPGAADDC